MAGRLRLIATSIDDLRVIAALTQDAVLQPGDLHYDPRARHCVLLLNRYRWEAPHSRTRVRSALRFPFVRAARHRDVDQRSIAGRVLSLMALEATRQPDDEVSLDLHFATGGTGQPAIRLLCETLDVTLEDLTDPWPATAPPRHPD